MDRGAWWVIVHRVTALNITEQLDNSSKVESEWQVLATLIPRFLSVCSNRSVDLSYAVFYVIIIFKFYSLSLFLIPARKTPYALPSPTHSPSSGFFHPLT